MGALRDYLQSDSVNRALVRRIGPLVAGRRRRTTLDIGSPTPQPGWLQSDDPEWVYVYTLFAVLAWAVLAILAGFSVFALVGIGDAVDGHSGRNGGIDISEGVAAFCLAGMAIAAWHSIYAYSARSSFLQTSTADNICQRNIALAQLRNRNLILQASVAVAVLALAFSGQL